MKRIFLFVLTNLAVLLVLSLVLRLLGVDHILDQRGTGRSTPVGPEIPGRTPQDQADYLTHFRADSIVRDAEHIRRELGAEPGGGRFFQPKRRMAHQVQRHGRDIAAGPHRPPRSGSGRQWIGVPDRWH